MVPVVPALVQLKVKNHPFAKAAGVRTDAVVTAVCHGQPAASDHGELQLTGLRHFRNTGFPDQPLYCQISVFKTGCKVSLDFRPLLRKRHFLSSC